MATDWTIGPQHQVDVLTQAGTFDPSMEIHFTTVPEGVQGQVTVSLRNYTPDMVRELIDARVAAIKAIQNL